jgi:hypothetical protein
LAGKEFHALLEAYLDCLIVSGAPALLTPILPTLREGPSHRYYKLITGKLRDLVAAVDVSDLPAVGASPDAACKAVNTLCGTCMAHIFDESQTLEVKQVLMDHLCFPLLRSCGSQLLAKIVSSSNAEDNILQTSAKDVTVIKQLVTTLQSEIPARDSEAANALVFLQSCAYSIIEIVYDKCSQFAVKNEVTKAYAGQITAATQKELTQTVCRLAHKLVRAELSSIVLQSNRNRLYAAAFSCLAVIVAKTQLEEKFFNMLVFDAKPEQSMWDHIIDCTTMYTLDNKKFGTVFFGCQLPGAEQRADMISQRGRARRFGQTSTMAGALLLSSSIGASQFATQSSGLQEKARKRKEMSVLDSMNWTQDIMDAKSSSGAPVDDDGYDVSSNDAEIVEGFDDQTIAVEMNELNTQAVMPSLLRVVQRMYTLFGSQWDSSPGVLPKWLTVCKDLLTDGINSSLASDKESKRNIRLFMLRFLLNQPVASMVAKHIQVLLPSIMECCLCDLFGTNRGTGGASNDSESSSMNYFLRDVIFALCNVWSLCKPDIYSKVLCWRFLGSAVNTIYDPDTAIFKENKTTVTTLLKNWVGGEVENAKHVGTAIDMGPLVMLLNTEMTMTGGAHGKASSRGSEALRKRLAALDILKALIDCGIYANFLLNAASSNASIGRIPCKINAATAANPVLACLFNCLSYPRKELMEESAGTLGAILNSLKTSSQLSSMATTGNITVQNLSNDISTVLMSKMTNNKGWDIVAACLKTISEVDVSFLDRDMFVKIHAWFRKMSMRAKYEYLSAVHNSLLENFCGDVMEHLGPYIFSNLSDISIVSIGRGAKMLRLPMVQITTLKLLRKHWRHIDLNVLSKLLMSDTLRGLLDESSVVQARVEAFEFVLEICGQHDTFQLNNLTLGQIVEFKTQGTGDQVTEIQSRLVSLLLKGLCDPDNDGVDFDDNPNASSAIVGSGSSSYGSGSSQVFDQSPAVPSTASSSSSSVASSLTQGSQSIAQNLLAARPTIRKRIYDYFILTFNLSENIIDRMHTLMTGLYEPQRSEDWLNYAAHLLLSLPAANSRHFTNVLFERALGSAGFTPLNINSLSAAATTKASSATSTLRSQLTPLFSLERKSNSQLLSQADQSILFGNNFASAAFSQVGSGFIRGTQEYSWTQTQEMVSNPSSRSEMLPVGNAAGGKKATLLATQSVVCFPRSSTQRSNGVASQSQTQGTGGIFHGQMPKFAVVTQQQVPRRFKKAAGAMTKPSYAYYNQDIMLFKANQSQAKKKLLAYRKYRDGELPDVAISLSDIVKPIQLLCLRDSVIAGSVVCLLLERSVQTSEIVGAASKNLQGVVDALMSQLQRIVSSGFRDSQLVSVILNNLLYLTREQAVIAEDLPLFRVIPSIVGEAALKSLNIHSGISLMEEQLLAMLTRRKANELQALKQASNKRKARLLTQNPTQEFEDELQLGQHSQATGGQVAGNEDIEDIEFWHQLGRLYNSLGERDIFLGLSTSLSSNNDSLKALMAEMDGDFSTASKLFSDLSEKCLLQQRGAGMDISEEIEEESPDAYMIDEDDTMRALDAAKKAADEWLEANPIETAMWNDRAIECLKQLCDWSGMETILEKFVVNDVDKTLKIDTILSDFSIRDRFLSPYVSCLAMFEDKDHADKLYNVCQQILNPPALSGGQLADPADSDQKVGSVSSTELLQLKGWLESRHSAELAVVYAKRKEWGRSRNCANVNYMQFMRDWAGLHPCSTQARKNLLRSAQRIVEIEDIALNSPSARLGQLATVNKGDSKCLRQLYQWCASEPSISDPVFCWDAIINQRYYLKNSTEIASKDTEKLVLVHLADIHRSASLAAISQGNLTAAKMQIEKSGKLKKMAFGRADSLSMTDVFTVCNYNNRTIGRKIKLGDSPIEELVGMFEKTLKFIDAKLVPSKSSSNKSADNTVKSEAAQAHMLKADWLDKYASFKIRSPGGARDASVSAPSALREQASAHYAAATNISDSITDSFDKDLKQQLQSTLYGKMAQHYDAVLAVMEESGAAPRASEKRTRDDVIKKAAGAGSNSVADIAKLVISTHVKGLQCGSEYCRSRLLKLLKVVGKYPYAVENSMSADNIAQIPSWMLLEYAPQLMGCLDLPEGDVAVLLLEHIAVKYPRVLRYPFKITSEFLGQKGRNLCHNLNRLLYNKSVDAFVEALYGISHPELRWKDGLKALNDILAPKREGKTAQTQDMEANKQAQEYYLALRKGTLATEWVCVKDKIGLYNKTWAKKVRALADEAVGAGGERLLKLGRQSYELLNEKTKDSYEMSKAKFQSGTVSLQEFSTWLAEFDHITHEIDIPGQDTGSKGSDMIDIPGFNKVRETILSVDPFLLVMSSIRKPKRIKFYSSNGKEYKFLVKGGEDLRNDERVESLFMLMNSVVNSPETDFESSIGTSKLQLMALNKNHSDAFFARTYAVVPMTSKVGLLEWVNNTIPLKSVIGQQMAKDAVFAARNQGAFGSSRDEANVHFLTASNKRNKWVGNGNDGKTYHTMFKEKDKESALKIFAEVKEEIPDHFLRSYLLSMCSGPESFITLRAEFAKTLAASSIFGYVLGIGDRHLDNLLLDTSTGSIVQIDFGICFGMGASKLPTPELMPFRLSDQLTAVLKPLSGRGLLKQYMTHCMRKLRVDEGQQKIINAMEVYVYDPVVDWMKNPMMKREEMMELMGTGDFASLDVNSLESNPGGVEVWEPRRRIANAVKKLNGIHPGAILLDDLASNVSVQRMKSFDALAAMIHDSCSSVNELTNNFGRLAMGLAPTSHLGGNGNGDSEMHPDDEDNAAVVESDSRTKRRKVTSSESHDLFSSAGASASGTAASQKSARGGKAVKASKSGAAHAAASSQRAHTLNGAEIVAELNGKPPLEAGQQIDMLVQLATDPQLMVRQWQGLCTWV